METLACGVPVIVTDFPFMVDLVRRNHCGLVIPPGDARALAEAVRYLYEHPRERVEMGRRGREAVVREHSWDIRAQATERILMEVLAKKRGLV
jgi:glycosyltransferase involved in cell wall biosynthesis